MTKTCRYCGVEKTIEEFYKNAKTHWKMASTGYYD